MGQFDTSGYVQCLAPDQKPNETTGVRFWTDLNPFTQGYVEALLRTLCEHQLKTGTGLLEPAFRYLAPETLARIMADCERYVTGGDAGQGWRSAHYWLSDFGFKPGAKGGAQYWEMRQAGCFAGRPPLTPYLGDDGKVYLRDGS